MDAVSNNEVLSLEPLTRLAKDLKQAAKHLTVDEARFLVDTYYILQGQRIRANNQIRALDKSGEPHAVITWISENSNMLEKTIKAALGVYSDSKPVGKWMRKIVGIGPVIAAGIIAHIDITRAQTAGAIWRYAGQDPSSKWEKKTKRPWNPSLKVICWKASESFVKFQNHKNDFYGKLYVIKKDQLIKDNDNGKFKDAAEKKLATMNINKKTDAYKAYIKGILPPAHIHARATRWVRKLFLAHLHEAWFIIHYGVVPPKPYVLEHIGGHTHKVEPPFIEDVKKEFLRG